MQKLEAAIEQAENLIYHAQKFTPKYSNASYQTFNIHQKLAELRKELLTSTFSLADPLIEQNQLVLTDSNLIEKLVARERLNTVVFNLYPSNRGFVVSVCVRKHGASERLVNSAKLPYTEDHMFSYLDNEEIPPVLCNMLDNSPVGLYYSGCVVAEIRDYRRLNTGGLLHCVKRYVLLRQSNLTILNDVNEAIKWSGGTDDGYETCLRNKLELESALILANYGPLCLDPSPTTAIALRRLHTSKNFLNTGRMRFKARKRTLLGMAQRKQQEQYTRCPGPISGLVDLLAVSNANRAPERPKVHHVLRPETPLQADSLAESIRRIVHTKSATPVDDAIITVASLDGKKDRSEQLDTKTVVDEVCIECRDGEVGADPVLHTISLTVWRRNSDLMHFVDVRHQREIHPGNVNCVSDRLLAGTREIALDYILRFTNVFTAEGNKKISFTRKLPGKPPKVITASTLSLENGKFVANEMESLPSVSLTVFENSKLDKSSPAFRLQQLRSISQQQQLLHQRQQQLQQLQQIQQPLQVQPQTQPLQQRQQQQSQQQLQQAQQLQQQPQQQQQSQQPHQLQQQTLSSFSLLNGNSGNNCATTETRPLQAERQNFRIQLQHQLQHQLMQKKLEKQAQDETKAIANLKTQIQEHLQMQQIQQQQRQQAQNNTSTAIVNGLITQQALPQFTSLMKKSNVSTQSAVPVQITSNSSLMKTILSSYRMADNANRSTEVNASAPSAVPRPNTSAILSLLTNTSGTDTSASATDANGARSIPRRLKMPYTRLHHLAAAGIDVRNIGQSIRVISSSVLGQNNASAAAATLHQMAANRIAAAAAASSTSSTPTTTLVGSSIHIGNNTDGTQQVLADGELQTQAGTLTAAPSIRRPAGITIGGDTGTVRAERAAKLMRLGGRDELPTALHALFKKSGAYTSTASNVNINNLSLLDRISASGSSASTSQSSSISSNSQSNIANNVQASVSNMPVPISLAVNVVDQHDFSSTNVSQNSHNFSSVSNITSVSPIAFANSNIGNNVRTSQLRPVANTAGGGQLHLISSSSLQRNNNKLNAQGRSLLNANRIKVTVPPNVVVQPQSVVTGGQGLSETAKQQLQLALQKQAAQLQLHQGLAASGIKVAPKRRESSAADGSG